MAFCANCGMQINNEAKFCPSCGQSTGAFAPSGQEAPPRQEAASWQEAPPRQEATSWQEVPSWQEQQDNGQQYAAQQYNSQQYTNQQYTAQQNKNQQYDTQQYTNQQYSGQYSGQYSPYQAPVVPGAPQQANIRDAQDNKTMAILAYILFFIPLLAGAHKTSPFAKYHTNQGTVLFLACLAFSIVFSILSAIITGVLALSVSTLGAALAVASILGIIWMIIGIAMLAFVIVGIINAAGGKMRPLPLIGRINIVK